MEEPKVLISKQSIKTMGKDIIRLRRDDVGVQADGKSEQKALLQELNKRKEEEEKLRSLKDQGRMIAEQARFEAEKKQAQATASEEQKNKEKERQARLESEKQAKRLMALQEARKKAVEEEKRIAKEAVKIESAKKETIKEEPKKTEEKTNKESLLEEKRKIKEEKNIIKGEFNKLNQKKKPLEERKKQLESRVQAAENGFGEIEKQEKEIEKKQAFLEEKEAAASDFRQRRDLEKRRWKVEKKREELEKARWSWDEKIEQLERQLRQIEQENKNSAEEERGLLSREKEINNKEEEINLKLERINLQEELLRIERLEFSLKENADVLFKEFEQAKNNLNSALGQEKNIEEEKKAIESEEANSKSLERRREMEKQRWQIEEKRRNIESGRWVLEEEKDRVSQGLKSSQDKLKFVLNKKENMVKRLAQINQGSEAMPAPEQKPEPPPPPEAGLPRADQPSEPLLITTKPGVGLEDLSEKTTEEKLAIIEEEKKAKIEEARKRIEVLKKAALERRERQEQMKKADLPIIAKQKLVQTPVRPEFDQEERRGDLLRRLSTPVSIYNKINGIKSASQSQGGEEKEKAAVEKKDFKEQRIKNSQEIIRVVPKKPSFREKLWVRALIVAATLVILAGILTFWYWYFRIRTSGPVYPPGYEQERQGIKIPPSLFSVSDTVMITISKDEELGGAIKKVLETSQTQDQFKRIIIKKEGEILGLKKIFSILGIQAMDDFYNNIIDEPTIFSYSQGQGNRLGFVAKISDGADNLNVVLKSMEPTIETDFDPFFILMGKTGRAIAPYFKNASGAEGYTGIDFRFKTLNQNDLGICYAVSNSYLVFTSSWKSMDILLNNLLKP